mmetsp:Transcript_12663/g.30559  ORF Transcript_12663/g.30559 Transcript_12663/m.30559 type:complete len:514 (+) Transcript_12663:268-1809(+)
MYICLLFCISRAAEDVRSARSARGGGCGGRGGYLVLLPARRRLLRSAARLGRAHEGDHAVDGADVRARRRHHDVGVRPRGHERARLHAARLHVGLHHGGAPRRQLLHVRPDRHARLRQGLDALHHGVHGVLHQVHLDAHQPVDGLVHGVHGAAAHGGVDARDGVRPRHLHRGRGEPHGAAHHLHLLQLPRHLRGVAPRRLRVDQRDDLVVHHAARLLLRHQLEAVEHLVQRLALQGIAQLLELGLERVAPAVLAHHHPDVAVPAEVPDGLRRDDLVRQLVLQHAVLVDAGLVREGVGPHDGLVRLHRHAAVLAHHLGARVDVHRVDGSVRAEDLLLPAHEDGHAHLLQARVAGALPDAVDGALHLPRAVGHARQGVGGGQPQVVLAVRGDHELPRHVGLDAGDELPELGGQADAHGVRDVKRGGARLHHGGEDSVQEDGVRAPRVLRAKLHIHAAQRPSVRHGLHGDFHHLVGGLAQLELHVDGGRGDEGVDARAPRVPHALPRRVDVALVGA